MDAILAYFPEIYPDELLYSALARYRRHTATNWLSVWLPTELNALASRLDPALGHDADWLIEQTTLFPYYIAFRDLASREKRRSIMKSRGKALDQRGRASLRAEAPPSCFVSALGATGIRCPSSVNSTGIAPTSCPAS